MGISQVVIGLLLPAALAMLFALIGSPWGAIVGLVGGLVVAFRGNIGQWPPFPPQEVAERIVVFAVPFGLAAMLASWRRMPGWVLCLLAVAGPAGIVWFVFKPLPAASMSSHQLGVWVGICTAIAVVLTASGEWFSRKRGSTAAAFSLGPFAAGAGALVLLTGNQKLGFLGGAIGLMILGWFLAGLIRSTVLARGPVMVAITLVSGLLAYGNFDSDSMTRTELVLVLISPLLAWAGELPKVRNWKPWKRELVRLIVVMIPIAAAVVLAAIQFRKDNSGEM